MRHDWKVERRVGKKIKKKKKKKNKRSLTMERAVRKRLV